MGPECVVRVFLVRELLQPESESQEAEQLLASIPPAALVLIEKPDDRVAINMLEDRGALRSQLTVEKIG